MAQDWFAQNAPDSAPQTDWFAQNAVKKDPKTVLGFAGNLLSSTASGIGNIAAMGAGAFEKPVRKATELVTGKSIQKTPEEESFDAAVAVPAGLVEKFAGRPIAEKMTGRKMAPTWEEQKADEAIGAYKNRYGSVQNALDAAYEDPFGVAMDVSTLAGGVSGALRGGAKVAGAANMGRTAAALGKGAQAAKTVAVQTNPLVRVAKLPGEVKRAVGPVTGKVSEVARETLLGKEDPMDLANRAIKPAATRLDFGKHLEAAMPDIKAAAVKDIESVDDTLAAVQAAKKANRGAYDQYRGPANQAGTLVDMSAVADAMDASVPDKLLFEANRGYGPAQAELAALKARNNAYRTKVPLSEAESLLRGANAELDAFYAKYPRQQWRGLETNPESAATFAKAAAARKAIYNALDAEGGGAAARNLQNRYGSLLEVEQQLHRRKNVASRQQPQSLAQQLGKAQAVGKLGKAALKVATGDGAGALLEAGEALGVKAASDWLKEQQTTDAMLKRAFAKITPGGAFPSPPPVNIRGLLEPGAIRMPGVADESFVRATPAPPPFRVGFGSNAPKQLPPASSRINGPMVEPDLSSPRGDVVRPPIRSRQLPPVKDDPLGLFQ